MLHGKRDYETFNVDVHFCGRRQCLVLISRLWLPVPIKWREGYIRRSYCFSNQNLTDSETGSETTSRQHLHIMHYVKPREALRPELSSLNKPPKRTSQNSNQGGKQSFFQFVSSSIDTIVSTFMNSDKSKWSKVAHGNNLEFPSRFAWERLLGLRIKAMDGIGHVEPMLSLLNQCFPHQG